LAAGSYLAISHGTEDGTQDAAKGRELYRRAGINWTSRPRSQVEALFTGWDLVEPGLVWVPLWRPESTFDVYHDQPESSAIYAGVARKN
jgi:hypothetical protein